MSDINNRSYQLSLAYNDDDLKKPGHDRIMLWLSQWVKSPTNVQRFFDLCHNYRREQTLNELDEIPPDILGESSKNWTVENVKKEIKQRFHQKFPSPAIDREMPWPNEPQRSLKFLSSKWELPLGAGSSLGRPSAPVGFIDLWCRYEIAHVLTLTTIRKHRLKSIRQTESMHFPVYEFEQVGEAREFRELKTNVDMFFEVKTEIESVGKLMRQLHLYMATRDFRLSEEYNGSSPKMIVVAPPHTDARQVCRDHGIYYLDYPQH